MEEKSKILIINSADDGRVLKALASEARIKILELLQDRQLNVNEIARELDIPQSTAATNVMQLESAGLVECRNAKGVKGGQKLCSAAYREILFSFPSSKKDESNTIEVEMPVGLFTSYEVFPPCGLCSREGIIGYLDVPDYFLSPDRVKACLVWFEKGYVEYKFPNNALYTKKALRRVELVTEMSSEVPGTNRKWLSDITVWINEVEIGIWTSPGDFGDRRGKFTPSFWKLEGSQYGLLKTWSVGHEGTFVDGMKISDVTLDDLHVLDHHSLKVRIGVKDNAEHMGGINIFGKGFGNYDNDILLRLSFEASDNSD
jgi:predicted transcriptional regulator